VCYIKVDFIHMETLPYNSLMLTTVGITLSVTVFVPVIHFL